jgi:hypothetical protein
MNGMGMKRNEKSSTAARPSVKIEKKNLSPSIDSCPAQHLDGQFKSHWSQRAAGAAENRHPTDVPKAAPVHTVKKESLYLSLVSACLIAPCLFSPRVSTLYSLSVSPPVQDSLRVGGSPQKVKDKTPRYVETNSWKFEGRKKDEIFFCCFPAPPVAPDEL